MDDKNERSGKTTLSEEEISFWMREYPELDREEIIEILEFFE